MGPLVSPARLELAYSNYGDPLRRRGRYGDLSEQVLIPCPGIRRQQLVLSVDADLPRLSGERHAGFGGGLIALPVVAGEAGRHQVLPGVGAMPGPRHHVIERQASRGQTVAAVLAGITVAQEDSLPGKRPIRSEERR